MPTYEYQCTECGHRFEKKQAITDKPIERCPQCGGDVKRLISGGAGFILKGSGKNRSKQGDGTCRFEATGKTCCGRREPCKTRPCGD